MTNKGLHVQRLETPGGSTEREKAFAEEWERAQRDHAALEHLFVVNAKQGDPGAFMPMGPFGPAWAKKPLGDVTERDEIVAATVVQWLGTNVGFTYIERALKASGYELTQIRFRS